jgi:hypothetical protein
MSAATRIGAILNVVRVGSEEQKSDYLNNTASALVRVVGPLRPPPPQNAVCRTLAAAARALLAGQPLIVLTTARNRFGAPVAGVTVHARGPGISQRARTNARGLARFTVTASSTATLLAVLKAGTPSIIG